MARLHQADVWPGVNNAKELTSDNTLPSTGDPYDPDDPRMQPGVGWVRKRINVLTFVLLAAFLVVWGRLARD